MSMRHYKAKAKRTTKLATPWTGAQLKEAVRLMNLPGTVYAEEKSSSRGTIVGRSGPEQIQHFVIRVGSHGDPRIIDDELYDEVSVTDHLWGGSPPRGITTATYQNAVDEFFNEFIKYLPLYGD